MNDTIKHMAGLLTFTGQVATSIRMYSAYNQGSTELDRFMPEDVMFLSDTLTSLEFVGSHIAAGEAEKAAKLCDAIIGSLTIYIGQPTFTRNPRVNLQQAITHLAGLKASVTAQPSC